MPDAMLQLLAHLWGDYLLQSDWMAQNKTKRFGPAAFHAFVYALPFLPLAWSARDPSLCWFVIISTHFVIDRYRLARYLVWAKNWLGQKEHWLMLDDSSDDDAHRLLLDGHLKQRKCWAGYQPTPPWRFCTNTGYPPGRPDWMAVWLLIIADNTLHLTVNYFALRYL
jgi:Protein of unknown function (DUF3307)